MRIYKHKVFASWARDKGISNTTLREAVLEINAGLFEANLGAGLYKKRIARSGQGKSGGYRTLIAFKQDDKAIFIFGFVKNNQENIKEQELVAYKQLAKSYLSATSLMIMHAVKIGELIEVKYDAYPLKHLMRRFAHPALLELLQHPHVPTFQPDLKVSIFLNQRH